MPRVNKCIELLEQGVPIFTTGAPELTYDAGRETAQTWADMVLIDFEHSPFDTVGLRDFMQGLKDGGPTPSGHPTPAVVTTLPSNCMSVEEVLYNKWQVRHVLGTGVHGILHTHARDPEAVRAFVATTRYPFQNAGLDKGLPEGLRGQGGQHRAGPIWGLDDPIEYMRRADPWPLNPQGELMLGLKIEDRHSLPNADAIAATPGLSFAEWGPGDMGLSFGDPDLHDPPYPPIMDDARNTIKSACDKAGLAFLCSWADPGMTPKERLDFVLDEIGALVVSAPDRELADTRRKAAGRTMPV